MSDVTPFYLSGVPATGADTLQVTSPWDGSVVGEVSVPTDEQVERAVADLHAGRYEAQAPRRTYGPGRWTTSRPGCPSGPRRSRR